MACSSTARNGGGTAPAGGADASADASGETGAGPPACDGTGNCNVMEMGCARCAYQGACKSLYDACQGPTGNAECKAYIACTQSCDGLDAGEGLQCATKCETDHKTGYDMFYRPMAKCAFCEVCKKDCNLPPTAPLCQ